MPAVPGLPAGTCHGGGAAAIRVRAEYYEPWRPWLSRVAPGVRSPPGARCSHSSPPPTRDHDLAVVL